MQLMSLLSLQVFVRVSMNNDNEWNMKKSPNFCSTSLKVQLLITFPKEIIFLNKWICVLVYVAKVSLVRQLAEQVIVQLPVLVGPLQCHQKRKDFPKKSLVYFQLDQHRFHHHLYLPIISIRTVHRAHHHQLMHQSHQVEPVFHQTEKIL